MTALWQLSGRSPDDVAVEDGSRALTWGELDRRTTAFGHGLEALGATPGSHVAISVGNRVEFLEAVLGAWRAGCSYTPLKTGWTEREVDHVLGDAATRVVVTDRDAARAAAAARGLPVVDPDEPAYEAWLDSRPAAPLPDDRCGWKLAYTSGTTGHPKGVVPSGAGSTPFAQGWAGVAAYAELLRLPGEGTHLFASRLFNGAPLTFGLGALARGARLRVLPRWDARAALAALADPQVTSTILVPTMLRQLLTLPDVDRSAPPAPGLRTLLHGGEPCPVPLKRALLEWFGPVLVEYYGFTEGGMTVADSDEWLARPGTVGRPMPGLGVRIVDDDGVPVPPRTEGLITFVAGGGRRFDYLGDRDRTSAAYVGDGFTVGDVGWLDEDGYLFVSGRRADVVITAGVNVYPAEIEEALAEVSGVADMCAVGVPDPERGEVVVLHVVPAPAADVTAMLAALEEVARERLAPYKRPARTEVVEAVPRDATGKLLRGQLRAQLAAQVEAG